MSDPIWEATLNEQYDVIVTPQSDYVAVLQIRDRGQLIFSDTVWLTLDVTLGVVDDQDIERWKEIVEDFVDESKFSYN